MERAGCSGQRAGTSHENPPAAPFFAGAAVAITLTPTTTTAAAQPLTVVIALAPSSLKVAPVSLPRHSSKQPIPMLIRLAALALLLVALWRVFRLAMGLRFAKVSREEARAAEEGSGRSVVAELPLSDAEVVFLVEDAEAFRWGRAHVAQARHQRRPADGERRRAPGVRGAGRTAARSRASRGIRRARALGGPGVQPAAWRLPPFLAAPCARASAARSRAGSSRRSRRLRPRPQARRVSGPRSDRRRPRTLAGSASQVGGAGRLGRGKARLVSPPPIRLANESDSPPVAARPDQELGDDRQAG